MIFEVKIAYLIDIGLLSGRLRMASAFLCQAAPKYQIILLLV